MSKVYISDRIREHVRENANDQCEYCLIPRRILASDFHIDHVIAEQHGGPTVVSNLALACARCNFIKGSNISTYLIEDELIVNLYHPRKDHWSEHFTLENSGLIIPKSKIGAGTIRLLRINKEARAQTRAVLMSSGENLLLGLS